MTMKEKKGLIEDVVVAVAVEDAVEDVVAVGVAEDEAMEEGRGHSAVNPGAHHALITKKNI